MAQISYRRTAPYRGPWYHEVQEFVETLRHRSNPVEEESWTGAAMIEPEKKWMVFLLAFAFVMAVFFLPCAVGEDVKITWHEEITLSADLSGVSLESVLEHLSNEQDIWFRVHKSVAEHRVSVHFTELPLEEGLRRIFAGLDYSLEFDGQGKPCGIVIVGEKEAARGKAKGASSGRRAPARGPTQTGPMGPDDPNVRYEEVPSSAGGPYGPASPPVEPPADDRSPYGPSGVSADGEKGARKPSPSDEPAKTMSPYGPPPGTKMSEDLQLPDESARVISPYGPDYVKPGNEKAAKKR